MSEATRDDVPSATVLGVADVTRAAQVEDVVTAGAAASAAGMTRALSTRIMSHLGDVEAVDDTEAAAAPASVNRRRNEATRTSAHHARAQNTIISGRPGDSRVAQARHLVRAVPRLPLALHAAIVAGLPAGQ